MLMDEGLDTGDILLQAAVEIGPQRERRRAHGAARVARRGAADLKTLDGLEGRHDRADSAG